MYTVIVSVGGGHHSNSYLSVKDDGLADSLSVVVTSSLGLVPLWVGGRVRDVLAGRSEEAALVVTLSSAAGAVAELVGSERELDADGGRKILREEDLRGPGLVELTGRGLGQLSGTESALVLGALLLGGDEPGGTLLGRLLGQGHGGQDGEEEDHVWDDADSAMTSNEVKQTLVRPVFNTVQLGSPAGHYLLFLIYQSNREAGHRTHAERKMLEYINIRQV